MISFISREAAPITRKGENEGIAEGGPLPYSGLIAFTMRALLCRLRFVGWLLALAGSAAHLAAKEPAPEEVLTHATQIRELPPAQTARALPVNVTGVIIDDSSPAGHAVILADQTADIYVFCSEEILTNYHQGDLVAVQGVTDPGQFAPIVVARTVRKLGTAPLPATLPVSYQQLITGALDSQWVEITGVVRHCFDPAPGSDIRRIIVAVDGGLVPVRFSAAKAPEIQVDAEVRIQAVCLYQYNQKRQVLSPVLQIPPGVPLHVKKHQPADSFAVPVRSAASLLQFSPVISQGHRVHVQGVVTYAQPGLNIWIRDASSGLRIQCGQQDVLRVGDEIDVLGFPSYGSSTPLLEDAVYRKISHTALPAPVTLTNFSQAYDHQDDLVAIEAKLIEIQTVLNERTLTLDKDGKTFKAVLRLKPAPVQPDWQVGSVVAATGICSFVYDESRPMAGVWRPQSFQILLRSAADLKVIHPPSWWTPKHGIYLLGAVAASSLLATGWVVVLSREQKRRRKMAESEFAAILSERNRLAREIHDTLAQGLGAISMQLELVKSRLPPEANGAGEHLEQAHRLVRSNLADARNTIWNMRSQVLETGNLASALGDILQQLSGNTAVEGRMRVEGRLRRLPPVTENNLLRIGQEAITNAMKHAQARLIEVVLEFAEKEVRLSVKDDGRGFDPAQPRAAHSGFGLVGMRERGEELQARLSVSSIRGRGTEIVLVVPVAG